MAVLGSGWVPLDWWHLWDSKRLILSPRSRIWVQFRSISMIFELFRKVATTLLPGIYRVFGPVVPKSFFLVLWPKPKRCATNSCADSWRYHLGKCLLWPFHAHLRFPFFWHFWKPLPFACVNPGRVVFTKFGHQPYVIWVGSLTVSLLSQMKCRYFIWLEGLSSWLSKTHKLSLIPPTT